MKKGWEGEKKVSGKERERRRLGERGVMAWFVRKSESHRISKRFCYTLEVNSFQNPAIWDNMNDPGGHYVK